MKMYEKKSIGIDKLLQDIYGKFSFWRTLKHSLSMPYPFLNVYRERFLPFKSVETL
jgi:hypothetical protein